VSVEIAELLRMLAVEIEMPAVLRRIHERDAGKDSPEEALLDALLGVAEVVSAYPLTAPAVAAFRARSLLASVRRGPFRVESLETVDPQGPPLAPVFLNLVRRLGRSDIADFEASKLERIALQYAEAVIIQQRCLQALTEAAGDPCSIHHRAAAEDRAQLGEVLLYVGVLDRFETLDGWLARWDRSVEGIRDEPATFDLDDLQLALLGRDVVAMATAALSPQSRGLVQPIIEGSDETFFSSTRPLTRGLPRPRQDARLHPIWEPTGWWWKRVPRNSNAGLSARLDHLGVN